MIRKRKGINNYILSVQIFARIYNRELKKIAFREIHFRELRLSKYFTMIYFRGTDMVQKSNLGGSWI